MINLPLSAILITKNEEKNINRCLQSLNFLSEVILIDSGSTDKTIDLAKEFKNVKIYESEWLGFSDTKRLAVTYTSFDWVFWIDADEEVSEQLRNTITDLFKHTLEDNIAAFQMPRKTFFMDEWVQHTGWYPGYVTRIFHKKKADFNQNILHEGLDIAVDYKTETLKSDLMHYSYTSLYQYFDKMNFYGKYGAEELARKNKKFRSYKIILSPLATFFKFYFIHLGFLDGWKGFIISVGSAFSNFIKYTNFYYIKKKGKV